MTAPYRTFIGHDVSRNARKLLNSLGFAVYVKSYSRGKHMLPDSAIYVEGEDVWKINTETSRDRDYIHEYVSLPCGCRLFVGYDFYSGRGGTLYVSSPCAEHTRYCDKGGPEGCYSCDHKQYCVSPLRTDAILFVFTPVASFGSSIIAVYSMLPAWLCDVKCAAFSSVEIVSSEQSTAAR